MSKNCLIIGLLGIVTLGACNKDDVAETGGSETASESAGDGDGDGDSGDGDGDGDSGCEAPPGVFGDCAESLDACMTTGPKLCVVDNQDTPSIAVCARRCTDVCDCWAAPPDGDAPVACTAIDQSGDKTCVLDCSDGQTCPNGMQCNAFGGVGLCMFNQ